MVVRWTYESIYSFSSQLCGAWNATQAHYVKDTIGLSYACRTFQMVILQNILTICEQDFIYNFISIIQVYVIFCDMFWNALNRKNILKGDLKHDS